MRGLLLTLSFLATEPLIAADQNLYYCARDLAYLNWTVRPLGPIFYESPLVLTSVTPGDAKQNLFVVMNGDRLLAAALPNLPVARVRFQIGNDWFYAGYMHGDLIGNRLLEFAKGAAPIGRQSSEYAPIELKPVEQLQSVIISLLDDQLDQVLRNITEGVIARSRAALFPLKPCEKVASIGIHAIAIRRNIDVLHAWTAPVLTAVRLPASIP